MSKIKYYGPIVVLYAVSFIIDHLTNTEIGRIIRDTVKNSKIDICGLNGNLEDLLGKSRADDLANKASESLSPEYTPGILEDNAGDIVGTIGFDGVYKTKRGWYEDESKMKKIPFFPLVRIIRKTGRYLYYKLGLYKRFSRGGNTIRINNYEGSLDSEGIYDYLKNNPHLIYETVRNIVPKFPLDSSSVLMMFFASVILFLIVSGLYVYFSSRRARLDTCAIG